MKTKTVIVNPIFSRYIALLELEFFRQELSAVSQIHCYISLDYRNHVTIMSKFHAYLKTECYAIVN